MAAPDQSEDVENQKGTEMKKVLHHVKGSKKLTPEEMELFGHIQDGETTEAKDILDNMEVSLKMYSFSHMHGQKRFQREEAHTIIIFRGPQWLCPTLLIRRKWGSTI